MASRYFSEFKEKRIGGPKTTPAPGPKGQAGWEAAKTRVTERTAAWPTPGPTRKGSIFNRKRMPTVKTAAKQAGV